MSLIIGILGRPNKMEREIISFSQAIVNVIYKYDGIPLGIIPNNGDVNKILNDNDIEKIYKMVDLCDGIILQGGKDYYDYDIKVIDYINNHNIPVLGICLGMQSLAASTGGKLGVVDLHKKEGNFAHFISLDNSSKLASIFNTKELMVNSRHAEKVVDVGQYKAVGWSDDGVIEAIEDSSKDFNIGVQWHPEDLVTFDNYSTLLFNAFFDSCQQYHQKKTK